MNRSSSLISGIILWLLPACAALFPSDPPPPPAPVAPQVRVAPPRPAPRHEFGSLWTDDSTWNDIYSASAARLIGDLVIVKLDENLKASIVERYDRIVPPPPEPVVVVDEDADPAKVKAAAAEVAANKKKEEQSVKMLHAMIREVRPRGMYVISGTETIKFGAKMPQVSLEALVRDRDIDTNDMVSSEQVLNLKVEVKGNPEMSKVADNTTGANK